MEESVRGEDLEDEHLEQVMGKLWRQNGVSKVTWLSKLNWFSMRFQGSAMHVRRKVIGPTLTEKQFKWNWEVCTRTSIEHATTVDTMDTRSRTVGNCSSMQKKGLVDTNQD